MVSLAHLLVHSFHGVRATSLTLSPNFGFLMNTGNDNGADILRTVCALNRNQTFHDLRVNHIVHRRRRTFILRKQLRNRRHRATVNLAGSGRNSDGIHVSNASKRGITRLTRLVPVRLVAPRKFALLGNNPGCEETFLS